jgi:hypothetical protein
MNTDQLLLLKQIAEISEARRVLAAAGIGAEQLPAIDKRLRELCAIVVGGTRVDAGYVNLLRDILLSFIEGTLGNPPDARYVAASKDFLGLFGKGDILLAAL